MSFLTIESVIQDQSGRLITEEVTRDMKLTDTIDVILQKSPQSTNLHFIPGVTQCVQIIHYMMEAGLSSPTKMKHVRCTHGRQRGDER